MIDALPLGDEVFVKAGYIRVYQDVRGKYGSEGNYLMTPPPTGLGLQPDRRRRHHRRVGHDRLAGEERAGIERPSGHDRLVLRGLHGGDGAAQSASGAEGGRARKPDGGWLDGRRLVPLRRLPPAQHGLLHRADQRARGKGKSIPQRELRRVHELPRRGFGGRHFAKIWRARPAALLAHGATSIRPTMRSGRRRRWTS